MGVYIAKTEMTRCLEEMEVFRKLLFVTISVKPSAGSTAVPEPIWTLAEPRHRKIDM